MSASWRHRDRGGALLSFLCCRRQPEFFFPRSPRWTSGPTRRRMQCRRHRRRSKAKKEAISRGSKASIRPLAPFSTPRIKNRKSRQWLQQSNERLEARVGAALSAEKQKKNMKPFFSPPFLTLSRALPRVVFADTSSCLRRKGETKEKANLPRIKEKCARAREERASLFRRSLSLLDVFERLTLRVTRVLSLSCSLSLSPSHSLLLSLSPLPSTLFLTRSRGLLLFILP